MARVTISNALVDSVNNNLKAFKQRELNQLHNPIMDGLSFSRLTSHLFRNICGRVGSTFKVFYRSLGCIRVNMRLVFSLTVPTWFQKLIGTKQTPVLKSTSPLIQCQDHMTESRQIIRVSPEVSAQYGMDKLIKYKADHEAIVERYRKVREDVATFLNKCRSLNEALKLWPAIAAYVDKDYVEKVNEVKPKGERRISEAMDALAKIDVDAVQATAVAARLANT
jgi:hypothetical protein